MTFQVVLLNQAETDIETNARWWALHHSVEQAVRWFDTVHQQLKSLEQFPESHGLAAENAHALTDVMACHSPSHWQSRWHTPSSVPPPRNNTKHGQF